MAGHSKWANIKHRKAAQDAKRGKIFTRLIREITVASREGGSDSASNPRLRAAIEKALSNNMTRDSVDKAVKRGAGELDGQVLETIVYEGYGACNVAVLVECLTDNKNRSVSAVRHAFTKAGGALAPVAYLFEKKGIIIFNDISLEDKVLDIALEEGALDVSVGDSIEVITEFSDFFKIKDALEKANLKANSAEISMIATTQTQLESTEKAQKFLDFLDKLDEIDDVQEVYHNALITDEIAKNL